jgi:hypothetical protein
MNKTILIEISEEQRKLLAEVLFSFGPGVQEIIDIAEILQDKDNELVKDGVTINSLCC